MKKKGFQRSTVITLLLLLILLSVGAIGVFYINREDSAAKDNSNISAPEYDERDSFEAILATSKEAEKWSNDAKLHDCSGVTLSSVEYEGRDFEFLGSDQGKYFNWICTYFSESKNSTLTTQYKEGEVIVDSSSDVVDLGEAGAVAYKNTDYPEDYKLILDSGVIYKSAVANGLDAQSNFYNMYLGPTKDYGYVWKVEELSKTEENDDMPKLVHTYVLDAANAQLIKSTDQEVN